MPLQVSLLCSWPAVMRTQTWPDVVTWAVITGDEGQVRMALNGPGKAITL